VNVCSGWKEGKGNIARQMELEGVGISVSGGKLQP